MRYRRRINNTSDIAFSNDSDIEDAEFADCPSSQTTLLQTCLKSAAIFLILIVSLLGNILVIRVVHRSRRMRTVAHSLIVNMAVADLLITFMNMPEAAKEEITGTSQWFGGAFGLFMCKLLPFCQTVSISCSIFTLVAISFDKFVAIVYPFKRIMTTGRVRIVIALIWLASFATASPQLIANNLVHDEDGSIWCLEEWPSPFDPVLAPRDYTIVYLVLLYVLPLSVITAFYSRVFIVIWRRKIPGNRTRASIRSQKRSRDKAMKIFIAVVICFALCWLTEHISFFLLYFVPAYADCGPPDVVWFLGHFFGFANSALNPCIYFLFNKDFRKGFKEILCCKRSSSFVSDIGRATRSTPMYSCTQEISGTGISFEQINFVGLPRNLSNWATNESKKKTENSFSCSF